MKARILDSLVVSLAMDAIDALRAALAREETPDAD